jgi:tetratricopeptide (TPR) repeat protein
MIKIALRSIACVLACLCVAIAAASNSVAIDPTPRHALEKRALTDPAGAQRAITEALVDATAKRDFTEAALLQLARANACRILADWACQSDAGLAAIAAGQFANMPILVARGKIVTARADILLQDFTRAESELADAELILKENPFPLLTGEILLAYSSLSQAVAKDDLTIIYADRGLEALRDIPAAVAIQTRLLRNRASALAKKQDFERARVDLSAARTLLGEVDDPKLKAELSLELARIAYAQKDVPTQVENANEILRLATQLQNSQLLGLGYETLGLAAQSAGDRADAILQLRKAAAAFRKLNLRRAELRALRSLLQNETSQTGDSAVQSADINAQIVRFIELQSELDIIERAHAADDFEAGLKYAEQQLSVARLNAKNLSEQQRNDALDRQRRNAIGLLVVACMLLLALIALLVWRRKTLKQLKAAIQLARENEARFRELSGTAQDGIGV